MNRSSMAFAFGVTALIGGTATAGPMGLVDDFSDGNLSEYTLTKVLDQNAGTSNVSFSSATGALRVSSAGTTGAEQVLLLRDDYSLAVGETLTANVITSATAWDRDIGIAVGYTDTPPGLGNPAAGDVRTSYVQVSFRGTNQIVSFARNGAANLGSGQEFSGTNYGGASFNTTDPLSLFITRLTANSFEVGWIQNAVRHVLWAHPSNSAIQPYVITDTNVPGAAVGFYADVRTDLAASPVGLDNLQIIPEPATVALLGIGGLLIAGRRRVC